MYQLVFKPLFLEGLEKLSPKDQRRVLAKLEFFLGQDNPLRFSEKLISSRLGTYRFRIGHFRVIFDLEGQTLVALLIGHRREIYR